VIRLADILIKLLGGFWKVKSRINSTKLRAVKKLNMLVYYLYLNRNGSYIGHTSDFSTIPVLPHGIKGIFISGGAKIGKDCVIFQQVTIGSNTIPDSSSKGAPVIGDNCYIGAGAKIIGGIKIGNNCRIGANCVVTENVADNCVVVLPRPVVIQKDALNNRFYSYSQDGWIYYENGKKVMETDTENLNRLNEM